MVNHSLDQSQNHIRSLFIGCLKDFGLKLGDVYEYDISTKEERELGIDSRLQCKIMGASYWLQ